MNGYPVVLTNLEQSRCLVIGGGKVAARKVQGLVDAGAQPTVVSPALSDELQEIVARHRLQVIRRPYQESDLGDSTLVIVATNDHTLNASIAQACRQRHILVNVVDTPSLCTFTAPAIIRRGDLLIAIATSGRSPVFARHMREKLEALISPVYGDLLDLLAALRPGIQQRVPRDRQSKAWDALLDERVLCCLQSEGKDAARLLAQEILELYVAPPDAAPVET